MGQCHTALTEKLSDFIRRQKMFFVGTADRDGRVNISPKGMDTLRVIDSIRIVWLNLTGSGNETAAHLAATARITLMFCAFEGDPLILRVYGQGRAIHTYDAEWPNAAQHFPALPGARQIIDIRIELVQTSCGFGVPLYDFRTQRELLRIWADKKGPDGIRQYWRDKNKTSLDGKPIKVL